MVTGPLVVTTSLRPSLELAERARQIAAALGVPYAARREEGIEPLAAKIGVARLLVVGVQRVALRDMAAGVEYAFHPNMIPVRVLNYLRGVRDLFLEATGLGPGDRLLDCTLGFASEAILGALVVGEGGQVVGLESAPDLAAVTREGLRTFPMPQPAIAAAMRCVTVVAEDYRAYLPRCEAGSFDVVYFDPFFTERLPGAENSVSPLFHFGDRSPLDPASVHEARRVATRRVVIKHPRYEALPPDVAREVSHVVSARNSRLAYSILEGDPSVSPRLATSPCGRG